jgi:lipopolysaccharide/colanic/teichoic acid biosynthesis glycosyltransferase
MKRGFDIAVALIALGLTWPFILAGVLAVRFTSPGPIFYRARRAGRNGVLFHMLKLRTMRVGTDSLNRRITEDNDDRITPVGHVLRKTRIDELPQFWNVLRGEMSVVGPRPEDWDIVQNHYTDAQRRVLRVAPGIVSPADLYWYPDMTYHDPPPAGVALQEHYVRRHLPAKLAKEEEYIAQQSVLFDIQVVAQTVVCVLFHFWNEPPRRPLTVE